jgi:peptidoglycan/xylan/chitin deacetylase (PgdA/CDA1 family)
MAGLTHRRCVAVAVLAVVTLLVSGCGRDEPAAPPSTSVSTEVGSSSAVASSTVPGTTTRPATTTTTTTTTRPAMTTPGASFPAGLRGQDLTVLPTTEKVVALTFDAGANGAGVSKILVVLAEQRITATFFLTGSWAAANQSGVSAIKAAGHRFGNHSMTHPKFTTLSDAAISDEVLGAQRAIQAAGADPRPLFRFPFGDKDTRSLATVNNLGYVAVRWTVDTLGWKGTSGGMSAQQVSDRVLGALRPGEIVLMHVGSNPDDSSTLDADALPGMIARIRAAGYNFATLDTLLR